MGEAIKRVRMGSGLSQSQAADRLAINHTYMSHLEAGRRVPSIYLLRKIAALPDVPWTLVERMAMASIIEPSEGSNEGAD